MWNKVINVVAKCIFTVNVVKLKSKERESKDEILHPDLFNASSLLSRKDSKYVFLQATPLPLYTHTIEEMIY